MKLTALINGLLLITALWAASAGGVDPRFDGRWVGIEQFDLPKAFADWQGAPPQIKTMFVIANSGQLLGVAAGFAPGKYEVSPKSSGRTLVFTMPKKGDKYYLGRQLCSLDLSADGNTLTESGYALMSAKGPAQLVNNFVVTNDANRVAVSATFHRVSGGQQKAPAKKR
jgi:hypothetical protein